MSTILLNLFLSALLLLFLSLQLVFSHVLSGEVSTETAVEIEGRTIIGRRLGRPIRPSEAGMRGVNNSVETVNAAASAIAAAEGRVQQTTVPKRSWRNCWSLYWCFGSHRHDKRISHAVLVPEPTVPGSAAPATQNTMHPPSMVLPFVAPPSSPASFLQSEPPSATHSPSGLLSLTTLSANVYSPSGPASIFAIGPYAYETQLVSPPVFSTFTTEPSTAPLTPPEPVHLTTPSSPEVPFAQLLISSLDPNHRTSGMYQKFPISNYEFPSYQLYPGSPVGHLISPSSAISGSGTSSPYPDGDFISGGHPFLPFGARDPPKILSIDRLSSRYWGTGRGSGSMTPDAAGPTSQGSFILQSQMSEVASHANSENESQNDGVVIVIDHRVSFELTAEDVEVAGVASRVEKAPATSVESATQTLPDTAAATSTTQKDGIINEAGNAFECRVGETLNDMPERASGDGEEEQQETQKQPSLTRGSVKEFNFDNVGGACDKPTIGSDWWANEKVVIKESGPGTKWAFFPMLQPGVG